MTKKQFLEEFKEQFGLLGEFERKKIDELLEVLDDEMLESLCLFLLLDKAKLAKRGFSLNFVFLSYKNLIFEEARVYGEKFRIKDSKRSAYEQSLLLQRKYIFEQVKKLPVWAKKAFDE